MKREPLHVVRIRPGLWVVRHSDLVLADALNQADAVMLARAETWKHVLHGGRVQIIIHRADGRIQRDVTLPRSSDPRRSRG